MNLSDFRLKSRARFADSSVQQLWTDGELNDFTNQAEREVAERSKLLEEDALPLTATVSALSQTSGIATATAMAHPFVENQVVRVAGADQAGYDIDAKVHVIDANHVSYHVDSGTTSPATGAAITMSTLSGIICNIAGKANVGTYPLDPRIFEIKWVRWNGRLQRPISREQLDGRFPYGWVQRTGTPLQFIDPQDKYLTLHPIPVVDAPITLGCYRYPFLDLAADYDVPEIAERYHFYFLDWIECLAYGKEDTEAEDLARSKAADAKFSAFFGPKIDVNTRRTQRERRSNRVQMSPFW